MKHLLTLMILNMGVLHNLHSQFSYYPPKQSAISEADYRRGTYILQNSYAQAKTSKNGVVAIDYWNIAMAYSILGQPNDTVYNFLLKSKAINESDFCKLATISIKSLGGIENTRFYKTLGTSFKSLVDNCSKTKELAKKDTTTIFSPGANKDLVYRLKKIAELDQKARNDAAIQASIDQELIKEIEEIITNYGYPGRKLVGEEYESIAWLVIQHADLSYQEKYLPVIHKAVQDNQLPEVPLKMLIDRIYYKKTGFQIFGSQGGVDFANDSVIEDVKKKYSIK